MSDNYIIQLMNIHKYFGNNHVLKGINLSVSEREVLVIIGPSGCGKSTLLRCINLLERPDKGEVIINGRNILEKGVDINQIRTHMGIVFQNYNLFPHMNVLQNVTLGLTKTIGMPKDEAVERAMKQLAHVGLQDKFASFPAQLSGGQQQRVAIARALAMEPQAILLDEITSALDPETVGEVLTVMNQLASEGMTMVVVTHEMAFAKEMGKRIVFVDQGIIVEEGPPNILLEQPRQKRTREFLSRIL